MTEIYRVRSTTTGGKVGSAMVKLGITGMGWQIPHAHANGTTQVNSLAQYLRLARDEGYADSALSSVRRLAEANADSLVWVLNEQDDCYYIGRFTDDWSYKATPQLCRLDLVNQRPTDWYKVGTASSVPSEVVDALKPRFPVPPTFCRAQQVDGDYCQWLYNRKSGQNCYRTSYKPNIPDDAKINALLDKIFGQSSGATK